MDSIVYFSNLKSFLLSVSLVTIYFLPFLTKLGATLVLWLSQSLTTTEGMCVCGGVVVRRDQVGQWLEQGMGEVTAPDPYPIHSAPCPSQHLTDVVGQRGGWSGHTQYQAWKDNSKRMVSSQLQQCCNTKCQGKH